MRKISYKVTVCRSFFIKVFPPYLEMNSLQGEPFSEEQWDQFLKDFEKDPQAFLTSEDSTSLPNPFVNSNGLNEGVHYEQVTSQPGLGWTYLNSDCQLFETQTDPISSIDINQPLSTYEEVKALYVDVRYSMSNCYRLTLLVLID